METIIATTQIVSRLTAEYDALIEKANEESDMKVKSSLLLKACNVMETSKRFLDILTRLVYDEQSILFDRIRKTHERKSFSISPE